MPRGEFVFAYSANLCSSIEGIENERRQTFGILSVSSFSFIKTTRLASLLSSVCLYDQSFMVHSLTSSVIKRHTAHKDYRVLLYVNFGSCMTAQFNSISYTHGTDKTTTLAHDAMNLDPPEREDFRKLSSRFHYECSDDDLDAYIGTALCLRIEKGRP